jgi:hypothetical protein
MKRELMPKGPPFSPEEIEAIVAAAPAYVYDPDGSYDPSNEEEVIAFWSKHRHSAWRTSTSRPFVENPRQASSE